MKLNNLVAALAVCTVLLFGCYDEKMEWGVPEGHNPISNSEIPLQLAEKIANYDFIKAYAPEGMLIGVGMGADLYIGNPAYKQVVDDNFQLAVTGNAMKHSSVVKNNGDLDFTTIDRFFAALPAGMKVYGHTLLWHTQQKQTYLKSLIAPEVIIESEGNDNIENIITNSDFEGGSLDGWNSWGGSSSSDITAQGEGYESDYAAVLVNPVDGNAWSAQFAFDLSSTLEQGVTYAFSFWAKSNIGAGKLQFQVQNGQTYDSQEGYSDFDIGNSWILCEDEFTITFDDVNRVLINFGEVAGTYYIDNFRFGKKKEDQAQQIKQKALKKSQDIIYVYKTPEEKKTILLGAMENWIQGMMEYCGDRVIAWDVINEPIADNSSWRGINGNFMSNGEGEDPDTEPVEDNGLNLNWANDHFYWGYYIGKEYAVKAFEYARKYAPEGTQLFVNDYNLEHNPQKLNALIALVNYVEENGQTVDGIGTQMHVTADTTAAFKARVDDMFTTMAATGKLVRVTEFDVQVQTATPSAEQMEIQALTYQYVVESYIKHVPPAQRSGITIWGLTDDPKEHEYWLSGDTPNLFNKDFSRKHAYKGFCDGLAGRDIGEDFSGDDYKNAYESDEDVE